MNFVSYLGNFLDSLQVFTFEEMKTREGICFHKPVFCPKHPEENLKYFCDSCQVYTRSLFFYHSLSDRM